MNKLLSLFCLCLLALCFCSAAPANQQNDGRYRSYYNGAYYRNPDFYQKRRYYDHFFKQYNPNVAAQQARIVEQRSLANQDGVYAYNYETENGIHGEERGETVKLAADVQAERVQGAYSFITPEGVRVGVRYTADEHGYHPIITYDGANAQRFANQPAAADVVHTRIN